MLAALLSAVCLWFSWRALRRCLALETSLHQEQEPVERSIVERELSLRLALAKRGVQAWGRVALFGGTGFAFWEYASGAGLPLVAGRAFLFGLLGWGGCRELERRIGSLAESWRQQAERKRRLQGVDRSSRTR